MEWIILLYIAFIVDACTAANIGWMNSTLRTKFSQNRHHVVNPDYKAAALQFITKYMKEDLKLDVYHHNFSTENQNVTGTNVVGVLMGEKYGTADDVIYGIGTHYDTYRTTNGVNDNGSGMTIMLDVAKEIAGSGKRNYTLLFIAFDFEEPDSGSGFACEYAYCGSEEFVNDWIPYFMNTIHGGQPSFGGFYVMDTVLNFNDTDNSQQLPLGFDFVFPHQYQSVSSDNFDGDFMTIIGRQDDVNLVTTFTSFWSNLTLTRAETERVILPISGVPTNSEQFMFGEFFRSDHRNFWNSNISAVFLTDTADFRGYMKNCYHEICDNVDQVSDENLQFMLKTSNALRDALLKFSPQNHPHGGASNIKGFGLKFAFIGSIFVTIETFFRYQ